MYTYIRIYKASNIIYLTKLKPIYFKCYSIYLKTLKIFCYLKAVVTKNTCENGSSLLYSK